VEVWENENCCGNTSLGRVFPQPFRVLPNFHDIFYNSIETRRTCFLFLLENTAAKKRETTCLLWSSKCKFSVLAPSLRQQLVLVLCFCRVIKTWLLKGCFLKTLSCFNFICCFISSVQAFLWWFCDLFCRQRILESKLAQLVRIPFHLTKKPWETSLNSWKLLNGRCRKKGKQRKTAF